MKELLVLNPESATETEWKNWPTREAARAIVLDADGKIALLHVSNESYYKLPGGGLEDNEDKIVALRRECEEEIGCDVDVFSDVGIIVEYRKFYSLKQISYCYLARVKGDIGKPNFTETEIAGGFENVWLPFDEAITTIKECHATTLEGREYIVPRDTLFLETARGLI
ncbi:NUDIX domain-containing protein [Candidatus Kaiserbacteria bacterium]|nr:NUDIX domain-containing protein [Candidatus Kaiserbacteria bacterium]